MIKFWALLFATAIVANLVTALIVVVTHWDFDHVLNYAYSGALGIWIGNYLDAKGEL